MKIMKKRVLVLGMLLMAVTSSFAEGGTAGPLTWVLEEGTLTISGVGAMPDYYYVSDVPWYSSRSLITTVVIEDGVTRIGDYAFYLHSNLRSVTIPNSVTTIGERAFYGCYMLSSVTIPNSVTTIGSSAFYDCSSLSSVTIPNSVTTIGWGAFYNCSSLSSVTIPNSVTAIGNSTFWNCISLSSITSNAIHPPALGSNTFSYVPKDIPVYIPYEADYNAYQNSDWGKYFTNITAIVPGLLQKPEICLVSADENNRNKVVWKKNEPVAAYNIYREGTQSGQYERVATIEYDSPNSWIDAESNANDRSYRYKVSAVDACGNESELSSFHQTIHLSISQGTGNQWDLHWTPYEGVDYETYAIYRTSGSAGSEEAIATLPGDNTSYTDTNAPSGTVSYWVEISLPESFIRSNVVTGQVTALSVGVAVGNASLVTVSDISGKTVLKQWVGANETVSISHLPKGIYIVNAGGKVTKIVQ
jgi:hypothetical protein